MKDSNEGGSSRDGLRRDDEKCGWEVEALLPARATRGPGQNGSSGRRSSVVPTSHWPDDNPSVAVAAQLQWRAIDSVCWLQSPWTLRSCCLGRLLSCRLLEKHILRLHATCESLLSQRVLS
jgi:hypothetical protein